MLQAGIGDCLAFDALAFAADDLIELLKIVSIEPQFDRREIFLELGKALRPRDDLGDEWLGEDLLSVA